MRRSCPAVLVIVQLAAQCLATRITCTGVKASTTGSICSSSVPAFLVSSRRYRHPSSLVAIFSSTDGSEVDLYHGKGEGASPTATTQSPTLAEESLYSTAYAMICASTLIYRYASLLRKDSELKAMLEPPISIDRALFLVLDNIEHLFEICSKEEAKNVLRTLHSLRKGSDTNEWIAFEDPTSNKECAYGIIVNHEVKRCTVVFRGSDNNNDWVQDGKIPMMKRNNPVRQMREQVPSILLHKGFDEYLFTRGNKVNQILYQVKPYTRDGYSLCFGGHSMGGSLATIAGLYAAAAPITSGLRLSSPVQVYTFGSSRVGDKAFYDAFVHLECRNKIRHARFHNRLDLVARLPTHSPPPSLIRYAHVGLDITLQADKPPKFSYAPSIKDEDDSMKALLRSESFQAASEFSRLSAASPSVGSMVGKGIYHDVATYLDRITKLQKQQEQQQDADPESLEEIYQRIARKHTK